MTRKKFQLGVAFATAAIFSLAMATSASAQITFTAPANPSFVKVSPTIEWSVSEAPVSPLTCVLEFNNALAAASNPCTGSPYFGIQAGNDYDLNIAGLATIDGLYELTVTGDFGVSGVDVETFTFTRDNVAPVVSIDPVASPTNDNTPTISFSQTELNPGTIECVISASGQQSDLVPGYAPCTLPFTPGSPVADGQRALYIRSTDAAGNIGYAAQGFIVDTVAPVITVTSPQPNQVMQSSVPELSFGAVDPDPGTGVSSFSCRYDSDAFAACNDVNFVSKNLPHGAHSLTIQATDGAANVATSVIPFSVDTDLGADPPAPSRVTFKKKSGKRAGKSYKLSVTASFTVPDGVDPALACKGKVRLSVTGRLPGKKSKTFTRQPSLSASGRTCVTTATFTLPKAYKGKRLTTKLIFRGNTVFGGFQRNGSIKKA